MDTGTKLSRIAGAIQMIESGLGFILIFFALQSSQVDSKLLYVYSATIPSISLVMGYLMWRSSNLGFLGSSILQLLAIIDYQSSETYWYLNIGIELNIEAGSGLWVDLYSLFFLVFVVYSWIQKATKVK